MSFVSRASGSRREGSDLNAPLSPKAATISINPGRFHGAFYRKISAAKISGRSSR